MIMTRRQSAVVYIFKRYYATQRLNARDLMNIYILGFIEGDGYISVSKKGKYISYCIGIEVSIKDIKLLYKIKKHLGIGSINTKIIKNNNNKYIETAIYRIRDKNHIKNIIIPIMDKYPLLTNKYYDYLHLKNCINNNIIYSDILPEYKRPKINNYLSVNQILNTEYFPIWLIGFIEAEGCFSIYESNNNTVASFEISQTNEYNIIEAIRIYFKITSNVYIDKTNSCRIKTTSYKSLQNILNILNKTPIKFQGNKKIQYLIFLKKLRQISKFNHKLNIPNKY